MIGRHTDFWATWLALIASCHMLPHAAGCSRGAQVKPVPVLSTSTPLPETAIYCPDEYLKWSLRWRGLEAATTEMITGQPGEIAGGEAIIVYSLSRSSELAAIFREVREELSSQVSLATGRSLRNHSDTTEDGSSELLQVEFSETDDSYAVQLRGSVKETSWTHKGTSEITDLHSFLARLRYWDGEPASGAYVFVQNGRSHFRVDLAKRGTETIDTSLGEVASIRIQGVATRLSMDGKKTKEREARAFTLWRSDDERYLPLRFESDTRLGMVRGSLVDARQPNLADCLQIKGS